jgi:hypothetical protein
MATTNHGNDPVTGVAPPGNPPNPCNLYYQDTGLTSTASQAIDLTLIGETETNPLTPDEVIVVKLPASALGDALIYDSHWTGPITTSGGFEGSNNISNSSQKYPKVVFRPKVLVDNAKVTASTSTALGRFHALDPDYKAQYTFTDDSGDTSLWTLQSYFANEPFTYSDANAATLSQIPAESVKSVEMTKISAQSLTSGARAIQGATNFVTSEVAVLDDSIASNTAPDANSPEANDYPLDLFQQADAAGKVAYWQVTTTVNGTSGSSSATPASNATGIPAGYSLGDFSKVSFVAGDSITVYVTYNMTKTKTFKLDGASGADAKYQITGSNGTVVNVANNHSMTSDVRNVVIAYQFMAEAD